MARVSVSIPLEIVLVFGLRFPEIACRQDFRHDSTRPQPQSIDVRNRIECDPLLLLVDMENRGTIARTDVVPLSVDRAGSWIWKKNSRSRL